MKNLLQTFDKNYLDDIIFTNRNKAYGAYVLRKEYTNQLTKALLVGISFFTSLSLIPLIVSVFESETVIKNTPPQVSIVLHDVDDPKIAKAAPAAVVPDHIKTVINPIYTPVRDLKKDKPLPTQDDFDGAAIGDDIKAGLKTDIAYIPPIVTSGPPSIPHTTRTNTDGDPDKPINQNEADIAADFKGGINTFREIVAQNFDTSSVENGGMLSAIITFVVEKDGTISNIKVTGSNSDFNLEAERTVKSIKTKWIPAQLKGKSVRSSFRMPISMKVE